MFAFLLLYLESLFVCVVAMDYVCLCTTGVQCSLSQERVSDPLRQVTDSCDLPGSLHRQPVILTTEPSLQLPKLPVLRNAH